MVHFKVLPPSDLVTLCHPHITFSPTYIGPLKGRQSLNRLEVTTYKTFGQRKKLLTFYLISWSLLWSSSRAPSSTAACQIISGPRISARSWPDWSRVLVCGHLSIRSTEIDSVQDRNRIGGPISNDGPSIIDVINGLSAFIRLCGSRGRSRRSKL